MSRLPAPTPHTARRSEGDRGEEIASNYLAGLGWSVEARNIHVRGGEVDIWARDGSQWVVVEVRSRHAGRPGEGLRSITRAKRRRLARAGMILVHRTGDARAMVRFDVIEVDLSANAVSLHVRGAFGADGEL